MSRVPPHPLPIEPYFRRIPGSAAFLQAVAEEPDEDGPRLVFADWLEENGHPDRAEFIRVQCELARCPDTQRERRHELSQIEEQLLDEHESAWREGLEVVGLGFERGMLEVLPLSRFVALSEEEQRLLDIRTGIIDTASPAGLAQLLECARLPQVVTLRSSARFKNPTLMRALARGTRLTGLRHLNLYRAINEEAVAELHALPFLAQLRSLNLGYSRLGDDRFLALLRRPSFPRLRRLELELCCLEDPAAVALAASEKLAELTFLDLSRNRFRATGAAALASSTRLANLTHLDLRGNDVGVTARQALAEARAFPRLAYLAMDGHVIQHATGVGLARVQEVVREAPLTRPTHLDLASSGLTAEKMRALLDSPALDTVTSLNLQGALVKPGVLAELAGSPRLARIRALDLSRNGLKTTHVKALAQSPHAAGLLELDVGHNKISLAGAEALVTSPYLKQLARLNLSDNELLVRLIEHSPRFARLTGTATPGQLKIDFFAVLPHNDLARELAASPYLADFTHLEFSCWRVTDEGFLPLARSPHLANLTHLTLTECWNIGLPGVTAFVRSPHLAKLERLQITPLLNAGARALIQERWPDAVLDAS